jgi:hypothetical protein
MVRDWTGLDPIGCAVLSINACSGTFSPAAAKLSRLDRILGGSPVQSRPYSKAIHH